MKLSKALVAGLVVAGSVVLLSSVSFADGEHKMDKTKTLNDAAAALKASKPDLSASLTKWAAEEAAEKEDKKEDKAEGKEKSEDMKGKRAEHLKLLQDSAAALQTSNPDLAASLTKMVDHMNKKMEAMQPASDKK